MNLRSSLLPKKKKHEVLNKAKKNLKKLKNKSRMNKNKSRSMSKESLQEMSHGKCAELLTKDL